MNLIAYQTRTFSPFLTNLSLFNDVFALMKVFFCCCFEHWFFFSPFYHNRRLFGIFFFFWLILGFSKKVLFLQFSRFSRFSFSLLPTISLIFRPNEVLSPTKHFLSSFLLFFFDLENFQFDTIFDLILCLTELGLAPIGTPIRAEKKWWF